MGSKDSDYFSLDYYQSTYASWLPSGGGDHKMRFLRSDVRHADERFLAVEVGGEAGDSRLRVLKLDVSLASCTSSPLCRIQLWGFISAGALY